MKQLTYCMSNGEWDKHTNTASSKFEQQIMWRLLSHSYGEMIRICKYANEYKSCPEYIRIVT